LRNVLSVIANRPVADYAPARTRYEGGPADWPQPRDRVSISVEARKLAAGARGASGELTEAQLREVTDLRRRDAHVRAHEAAHQAAAGGLAGTARYTFRTGPDGRAYAVGGEVALRSSGGRTPDETISIARRIRAAALAPADPSPADLAAASAATAAELRALDLKRRQADSAQAASVLDSAGGGH